MLQPWEAINWPAFFTTLDTSVSQLSEAVGNNDCAFAKAVVSLHSTVVFRVPIVDDQIGAVVSWTVITWVNITLVLPHSSFAVQVFVYEPALTQFVEAINTPEVLV